MSDIHKGCLVESIAGRDKGKLFLVVGLSQTRASIVDGDLRKTSKPKLKNLKHLRFVSDNMNQRVLHKIDTDTKLEDAEVRKALRLFLSEEVNDG